MLGIEIIKRRKELGLKQKELAEMVGVSSSVLCLYEKGKLPAKQKDILKIAKALNCNIADLKVTKNDVSREYVKMNNMTEEEKAERKREQQKRYCKKYYYKTRRIIEEYYKNGGK